MKTGAFQRCLNCGKEGFDPGVVGIYKSHEIHCRYCEAQGCFNVPVGPTNHRPGSWQKIAILAERYSRKMPLWHSKDRSCLNQRLHTSHSVQR
jgi:hypothetical protein